MKFLELIVCPSDDYPGLIDKELPQCDSGNPYFDDFESDSESDKDDDED